MLIPIADREEQVAAAIVARFGAPFSEVDLRIASTIGGKPAEPLQVTGPALAIDPEADYQNLTVGLGENDLVLCYADGITEARRDAGLWGYEGVLEALLDCPSFEPRAIVDHVYERALEYSRGRMADGVALLALARG
jgi:serine phosphatase RsbU (regulator of sigma subunit)